MNYKKLYLEQKTISLNLEMQLMSLRAQMIEGERAELNEELKECTDEDKEEKECTDEEKE